MQYQDNQNYWSDQAHQQTSENLNHYNEESVDQQPPTYYDNAQTEVSSFPTFHAEFSEGYF